MKCPKCGDRDLWCGGCGEYIKVGLINPTELLDLIEKADWTPWAVDAIKSYLSGDPSTLKALAGVE